MDYYIEKLHRKYYKLQFFLYILKCWSKFMPFVSQKGNCEQVFWNGGVLSNAVWYAKFFLDCSIWRSLLSFISVHTHIRLLGFWVYEFWILEKTAYWIRSKFFMHIKWILKQNCRVQGLYMWIQHIGHKLWLCNMSIYW